MTRLLATLLALSLLLPTLVASNTARAVTDSQVSNTFRLGNEVLLDKHRSLLAGKRVGLVTNQSGVNNSGQSLIDVFAGDPNINLTALYGPEHGIDGKAPAGVWVESYTHPTLKIPVYSLYGSTRKPTPAMLAGIDVLVFDIQDIGARTYTYISTMNYCMLAAKENNKQIIVLDRPNPLGGLTVEGPVLEDNYKTFVGVDNLPMAHGMTIGELALYFNRLIGANLVVVRMEGYSREMIYQDTGLSWVQTSPNIPDIESVFGYMATGLAEGTGVGMAFKFKWVGGRGLESNRFAALLNGANLPGVVFTPEPSGSWGGARLTITDFRAFNPAKTGLYALFYARQLWKFAVPKSGPTMAAMVMFDKVMGTNKVGLWLERDLSPQQMEKEYQAGLNAFRKERAKYLLYGFAGNPANPSLVLNGHNIYTDVRPIIINGRTLVPVRVIAEQMGATVTWIERENAVVIAKANTTIRLVLNSRHATVNGISYTLDVAPVACTGRTMAPMRFVSEYLGAEVEWCDKTFAVSIKH